MVARRHAAASTLDAAARVGWGDPGGLKPVALCGIDRVAVCRRQVFASDLARVERLDVDGPHDGPSRAEDFSPDYQVCLPYRGAFVWHVGHDEVVGDPNRALFVTGGEPFRLSRPTDGGYGELIVTAEPALLAQILGVPRTGLARHPTFRARSRPASPALQRAAIELLHPRRHERDRLATEELLARFLHASLAPFALPGAASPSTLRLVRRAKAYLAEHFATSVTLAHIARAVGATPAHLTTVFRRIEGRPLHQYLVQLRLARALAELPHTTDITALACDLGFASHSHFTAAFRRTFGCTPSAFRTSMRRDQDHIRALTRTRP